MAKLNVPVSKLFVLHTTNDDAYPKGFVSVNDCEEKSVLDNPLIVNAGVPKVTGMT